MPKLNDADKTLGADGLIMLIVVLGILLACIFNSGCAAKTEWSLERVMQGDRSYSASEWEQRHAAR